MPRITELYCFAISDRDDDDEGVPALTLAGTAMPLIGADLTRIKALMPHVQRIADEGGKPIRIYRFSQREQIGEVSPRQGKEQPGRTFDSRIVQVECGNGHLVESLPYVAGISAAQTEFGGSSDITLTADNAIEYLRGLVDGLIKRRVMHSICTCGSPRSDWKFTDRSIRPDRVAEPNTETGKR